ncbi:unnamed protein product [Blepharisma stoltei]|uniref:Importin subunit alpha n=1 Tax=Blepharisma stoltei TaxID=1481888 RepID=A0AAU9JTK6_9CILI|nr:unnamed protein product [Blepharisma stoltei]
MEPKFGFTQNPTRSLFYFGESNNQSSSSDPIQPADTSINEISSSLSQMTFANEHSAEAVGKINSDDPILQLEGLQFIRKELSQKDNPPINEIINSGICRRILDLASTMPDDEFLFEATWVFSNILSGNSKQTAYLVNLDVIPFLFRLFDKTNDDIKDQVMWAFGNIAGDNTNWRDLIISNENFGYIIDLCNNMNFSNRNMIKTCSWAVSNFLRGSPQPVVEKVLPFVRFLKRIIVELEEQEILTDALWGCFYITELHSSLEAFQKKQFLEKIIRQLSTWKIELLTASLKTIGNITSQMENSFSVLFRLGFLEKIDSLLCHQKRTIRKEACWILSNMSTESCDVVAKFLENKLYEKLLHIMKTDSQDVKKEAIWVIANSATVCDSNQVINLAQLGMVKELINCIKFNDCRNIALEALCSYVKKVPDVINAEEKDILIKNIDLLVNCGEDCEHAMNLRELLNNRNGDENN